MTTTIARLLIALMAITQIPLAGEVFAQEEEVSSDTEVLQEVQKSEPDNSWYKSERIFGNIDVGDFVVGPGRSEVSVKPGESVIVEVSVTNRISDDREFSIEIEDITGTRDGGSMKTVEGNEDSPFGVSDFISLPNDTLQLDLGERARLPVMISVPENTSPGGYFGAVMVTTVRQSTGGEGGFVPRSPIIARVASLVFLTVEGEVVESGGVQSLDTVNNFNRFGLYQNGPIEFGLLYENTGTVHLNPYGEVSIKNILGEEVGFLVLEPWFVLPNALRLREFSWDREFLFGRYTVEARINRGYDDEIDTITTSFWVLPWRLVGSIFIVLFIIIFAVRTFFRKFEFKRKDS